MIYLISIDKGIVMERLKNIGIRLLSTIKKVLYMPKIIFSKKYLVYPENTKTNREYSDLAPEEELTNAVEYYMALDWALNNERITNIAIAGPYGSGKSSIIRSYLKKHPELKYINISLANFLEYSGNEDCTENRKLIELGDVALELGILKQLFYKVNYRRIPQSRYRKLRSFKKRYVVSGVFVLIVLAAICSIYLIPNIKLIFQPAIQNAEGNLGLDRKWIYVITLGTFAVLFHIITNLVWRFFSRVRLKEVNVGDRVTVSTDENGDDDSIFNKNMDEIVYFFEATEYNVVFLEDLDRFESADIFVKLRELNTILNNYEVIKKRIVFVYAIKDDMFSEKERTKFFEFILPVIPIINATNSGEILLKKIRVDGENMKFDISEDYITLISPFIDDMRILTNIYNEFLTYKYTLQGEQKLNLTDQLMFSLMIFKNIYPKDFADLQAEKGVVKEAFNAKKAMINEKRAELESEKQDLIDILESIESDILINITELKTSMLYFMTGYNGLFKFFSTPSGQYNFFNIMDKEFEIDNLRCTGQVEYYYNNNFYTETIAFDGTKLFAGEYDYITRYNYLVENEPERKRGLQRKIEICDEKLHNFTALSLKELFESHQFEELLPENVRSNRMLVFFLRYGFIDEKYTDYMNYFHANSITKEDMNFILSVRHREAENFEYKLSKVAQVTKRLLPHEFAQREIYNFDLLHYLLSSDCDAEKCDIFIKQMANGESRSWDFINQFVEIIDTQEKFIQSLCRHWKGIWDYVFDSSVLLPVRKEFYLSLICSYGETEDIRFINENGKITKYFVNDPNILINIGTVPNDKMKSVIEVCDINFSELEISGVNDDLLDWIFDNNHYKITISMFMSLIRHRSPECYEDFLKSSHTTLMNLSYTQMLNFIDLNFEEYVQEIVLGIYTNTEESLEAVLDIIQRCKDHDCIMVLIQKENVVLNDLEKCKWGHIDNNDIMVFWDLWMDNNKLKPTWKNVVVYWHYYGVTSSFVRYLVLEADKLIQEEYTGMFDPAMIAEIIQSDMEADGFEKIMTKLRLSEFDIPFSEINQEHLFILIKLKYFTIIPAHIEELRRIYPDLLIGIILNNKELILESITDYILTNEEIELLIRSQDLSESEKIKFIYALNQNDCTMEIALFLRGVENEILKDWFEAAWKVLELDMKYQIFINQIGILTNNEIAIKFSELDEDYKRLSDRSRRHEERLAYNDYNLRLVEHLERVEYLTSFRIEEKEERDIITHNIKIIKSIYCRVKKE